MSNIVYISVGHGGIDKGAVSGTLYEKDINLSVAKLLKTELIRSGATVIMSREQDLTMSINEVVKDCNMRKVDLAVDIHTNAGGGTGFETFVYSVPGRSRDLGTAIEKEIRNAGITSRGVKTKLNSYGNEYYAFIRDVKHTSVILEIGFIDNPHDRVNFDEAKEQKKYAIAYAKGILATLGLSWIPESTSEEGSVTVERLPKSIIYDTIEEVPEWAQEYVNYMVDKGFMQGDGNGLDLEYYSLRMAVIDFRKDKALGFIK